MGGTYGENLIISIFGSSHGECVGVTAEGFPKGEKIDTERLQRFLERRAPGRNQWSTARKEPDVPEFQSGLENGFLTGEKLTAVIKNTNRRSGDYDNVLYVPRPGHADYTSFVKYGDGADRSGGGAFSGRMTAPLCVAGGIALQLLEKEGVEVCARVLSIGKVRDRGGVEKLTAAVKDKEFPTVSDAQGSKMKALIAEKKAEGDSVGGVVECVVRGLPAGLGGPLFEGMEGKIAEIVFAVPAVKGVEFGAGFSAARLTGSVNNDGFCLKEGKIETITNNAGGILGGITDGMPLVFRAAFKPTPSIAIPQRSVDLRTMTETEITVRGRHDPCIVPRAVPVIEAAAAVAVYDALLVFKDARNKQ